MSDLPMPLPPEPKPDGDDSLDAGRRRADEALHLRRVAAVPLRGRHVAIVGEPGKPSARLFERAAAALGARVSYLRPDLRLSGSARDEAAVRLLGTLYDAIDGVGLDAAQALELQQVAGIPVFADLGGPASPLRARLRRAGDEQELQGLVEAALMQSLA